jgi:hypothetical protein
MRRRALLPALIALFGLLCVVAASQAEVEQSGNIRVKFSADFDPRSLPRLRPAPIEVHIHGSVQTTDGSHPPPLRWLEVELNRNGQLETKGLPTCSGALLQSTSTEEALARCGRAVVGRGSFDAQVALGDEIPAEGKIIAFNSRRQGKPALFLHFFAAVPIRFTWVVPLTITRSSKGNFGTLLRTRVPKLAGGRGSVTDIELRLGRSYSVAGQRRSYLSAACGAPEEFNEAVFSFARARFRFEGHKAIRTTLLKSCHVRRGA